ncbi:MAG TPA: pyridoxal-phosphate dependent enzyme [Saprospiraceae bacterium]|nr:pyridoxal-phosphate dependent enzyme [Saprospiraceae bacterium]
MHLVDRPEWKAHDVHIYIKRDDLLHKFVQGNKWRKLKYNLLEAKRLGKKQLLTFGGAFSNHIHATAAAGQMFGLETIGWIRGDKLEEMSPTLVFAQAAGMELVYVDRTTYRRRKDADFLTKVAEQYPDAYIIPEGGSNALALKGVAEMVTEINEQMPDRKPMVWCVGVGSGGTMAGMIRTVKDTDVVMGFSSLKGDFVDEMVAGFLEKEYQNWQIWKDGHLGGFARWKPELIDFINSFYESTGIPLDPIYNGKLWYRLNDLILDGYFPKGSQIMVIHTGGLQGIDGFRHRFGDELLPNWKY